MDSTPTIGIVVLDTGYTDAPVHDVTVIPHDFCHYEPPFPGVRKGYMPHLDGSDSVHKGSGTVACRTVLQSLQSAPPFPYRVFSVKAGDSGDPLRGVSPTAVKPALRWVAALPGAHPDWRWVAYLNYDVTGVGEVRPVLGALNDAGIPVVLPAGVQGIDLDRILSVLPNNVLVVAADAPDSDYGLNVVDLAVAVTNPALAGPTALAWLALARHLCPDGPAGVVVNHVAGRVTPSPTWKGRSRTGGVLSGQPQ